MTIDWNSIKTSVANAAADALAEAQAQAFAQFPISATAIAATYVWDGTAVITTSDTSEVTIGDAGSPPGTPTIPPSYIRLDSDSNWYKVVSIVPNTSIAIEDTFSVGGFPTGSTQSSKANAPIPAPPSAAGLENKLAVPLVDAILDGVRTALDTAEISGVTAGSDAIGPGVIS